ncbi:MAG: SGNH/GDSL hydrolase family protein [Comamonas sp.]
MRKTYLVTLLATCFMSACGGDSRPEPAPAPVVTAPVVTESAKPRLATLISFGDSLSDVGTYAVGAVKSLGGGKFSINGDSTTLNPALTGLNWVEQLARRLGLPAPCAAQTGLDGDATLGFSVPVVDHAGCLAYAQGGARVTHPVGPTHKLTGSRLGALTVPVATQISRHLALSGGKFKADDLVLVMAGGNDLLYGLEVFAATLLATGQAAGQQAFDESLAAALAAGASNGAAAAVTIRAALAAERAKPGSTDQSVATAGITTAAGAAGNVAVAQETVHRPLLLQASTAGLAAGAAAGSRYASENAPKLVAAMDTAGRELVALVKDTILANGAAQVVVNNLPDVALTPTGRAMDASTQALIGAMVNAFNAQLRTALAGEARVLLVDANALTQDAAANPTTYGLTNVTDAACNLVAPTNPLRIALTCNATNLIPGDVSRYAYADGVHPTPYFYNLLTNRVAQEMGKKGWL